MSFQQRTIGEICSELLTEAIRMGYSKRYVWGHMSKYLSIIRGYYRSQHICIFSAEVTDACLASYSVIHRYVATYPGDASVPAWHAAGTCGAMAWSQESNHNARLCLCGYRAQAQGH